MELANTFLLRKRLIKGSKNMKKILGVFLIVAGLFLGVYVGVYLLLIGGITQVIEAIQLTPVDGEMIAWGIVKALTAELVGFITGLVLIVPGWFMIWGRRVRGLRSREFRS